MQLHDFDIDLNKCKDLPISLNFRVENAFFSLKENSLLDRGNLDVQVTVSRTVSTATLTYTIKGTVGCQCDRCLDDINIALDTHFVDVYKLSDSMVDEDFVISNAKPVFNMYDSIYEYICVSLPTRKICEVSEEKDKLCELMLPNETIEVSNERWEILNKLK